MALGCRDGYNMDVRPEESGPGAGTTSRGQMPQSPAGETRESWGTELCQGRLEGLRDLEDEQGFVRWDVTNVNIADALSSSIKQVLTLLTAILGRCYYPFRVKKQED